MTSRFCLSRIKLNTVKSTPSTLNTYSPTPGQIFVSFALRPVVFEIKRLSKIGSVPSDRLTLKIFWTNVLWIQLVVFKISHILQFPISNVKKAKYLKTVVNLVETLPIKPGAMSIHGFCRVNLVYFQRRWLKHFLPCGPMLRKYRTQMYPYCEVK